MAERNWRIGLLTGALAICLACTSFAQAADKVQVLALSRAIDAFIAAKQKEAGVTPAPRADDSTYFRRLNLDLNGRIPGLTEHRDFLGNEDPNKRWDAVERLLGEDKDHRDFLEKHVRNFAGIWRTHILGSNVQQQFAGLAPGFEQWLTERLKSNTPYNQVVRDILTSAPNNQGVEFARPVGMNATPAAFFVVNENKPENLAGAATRNFLGVKLECAQCHAHPFAQWTREQFWEFAAFFAGTQPGNRPGGIQPIPNVAAAPRQIKIPGTERTVRAKFLDGQEPAWKDNDSPRAVLADWITSADNPYFAKATVDQVWSYFFGISLLEPIMEPSDDSPITYPELLNEMARQFTLHNFDLKFLIRSIVHTEAYQRASTGVTKATKEDYNLFVRMPVRGMTPEQLFDSVAEATNLEQSGSAMSLNQPFNQPQSPRAQFLSKFTNQDRRHETQTSILQALFMMNGKYLAERLRPENNVYLKTLTTQATSTAIKVDMLYLWVMGRQPRPDEIQRLVSYIDSGGPAGDPARAIADVYWALLNSAEFMLNH